MELPSWYTPLYYNNYTQVKYLDPEYVKILGGIAYHDFILRGLDGKFIKIAEIEQFAMQSGHDLESAIIELSWADLNNAIL